MTRRTHSVPTGATHSYVIEHPDLHDPATVRSALVVTSLRVALDGRHAHISVWNRGGPAGTLVVDAVDVPFFTAALLPNGVPVCAGD